MSNAGIKRNTPAEAIRTYLDQQDIRYRRLVNGLGIPQDRVSRMLNDKGRYHGERLTAELIRQIARVLNVSRDLEDQWLDLLTEEAA